MDDMGLEGGDVESAAGVVGDFDPQVWGRNIDGFDSEQDSMSLL